MDSESEDGHSKFSDEATTGGKNQLGGTHDNGVIGIPTPPIEQVIQPRPCPRPMYQMPVPIPNKADVVTGPGDSGGAQSQIGGAPVVFEMRGDAGTVIEGANGAENECHYPRRSNCTNPCFRKEIDG